MKNRFKIKVELSDYTDFILRMKEFRLFDRAAKIDLTEKLEGNFLSTDLILLSRIDTEFEDEQLISLFEKFKAMGIQNILFLPEEILNIKTLIIKVKIILICIIGFKKPIQWGYIRSEKHFMKIIKSHFKVNKVKTGYYLYL